MSRDKTPRVKGARELVRKALGRPADSYEDFDGLPPRRSRPIDAPTIRWEPIGEHGEVCLTVGVAAKALGISERQLAAMAQARELTTVPVGDFGARMVPVADVWRVLSIRAGHA
jgi:hypothetical protein